MADRNGVRTRSVRANGIELSTIEAGEGPLALCLHGFPDSAHTWRHLLPELAGAGFHAVAPFMRGYAPSAIPADGCYRLGALVADAIALHEGLGADHRAVLIGHDWGAETAYGAAAFRPERWRRVVTIAVPPVALDASRHLPTLAAFAERWLVRRASAWRVPFARRRRRRSAPDGRSMAFTVRSGRSSRPAVSSRQLSV